MSLPIPLPLSDPLERHQTKKQHYTSNLTIAISSEALATLTRLCSLSAQRLLADSILNKFQPELLNHSPIFATWQLRHLLVARAASLDAKHFCIRAPAREHRRADDRRRPRSFEVRALPASHTSSRRKGERCQPKSQGLTVVMILSGSFGTRYLYGVLAGPKVISDALSRSSEHQFSLRHSTIHTLLSPPQSPDLALLHFGLWTMMTKSRIASRHDKGRTPGALHVTPRHGHAS